MTNEQIELLSRLNGLRESKAINESEFEREKARIVGEQDAARPASTAEPEKSKFWTALFLALYLGIFGAHRFYLKAPKSKLMLKTLGGVGLWVIYDVILLVIGKFEDGNGKPVKCKSPLMAFCVICGFYPLTLLIIGSLIFSPSSSTPKMTAAEKAAYESACELRKPYGGVYESTDSYLTLIDSGTYELKFKGRESFYGDWKVEGDNIRLHSNDSADTVLDIQNSRTLNANIPMVGEVIYHRM